jgi:uncharacterized glyoxalase superfamily protein PhnB
MATARLCPYVNFQGDAREAMTFYQSVLAFAGLMPAVRASRMPPTVALRTV